MSKRSANPGHFILERHYDFAPAQVFAAWANQEAKYRWFACTEGWEVEEYSLDFRVGGREICRGGPKGGAVHASDTIFWDIVPNERIIFSFDMHVGDARIPVSLTTVEFRPEGSGTLLIYGEQIIFLDGFDHPVEREQGTREMLNSLDAELRRAG